MCLACLLAGTFPKLCPKQVASSSAAGKLDEREMALPDRPDAHCMSKHFYADYDVAQVGPHKSHSSAAAATAEAQLVQLLAARRISASETPKRPQYLVAFALAANC